MTHFIETERLILRLPVIEDAPDVARIINEWDVVKYLTKTIPYPYELKDAHYFLNEQVFPYNASGQKITFSILRKNADASQTFMGFIGYDAKPEKGENHWSRGFWMGTEYHGLGYMTEAANATNAYMFTEKGAEVLYTRNVQENDASDNIKRKQNWEFLGTTDGSDDVPSHAGVLPQNLWRLTKERWLENQKKIKAA